MKKNKSRNHQKRAQKRTAKAKARKQVNAMTRGIVENLRKQGYHIPMQQGPDRNVHAAEDVVSIAKCSGVGECCTNVVVNLDPSDVWRIMNNEKVRQRYGAEVTMDLVSEEPDKGIIEYWVDPRVGVPRCKLRYVKKDHGHIECIFLENNEGKPECFLGEDRPTICKANPIGRVGQKGKDGRLSGWGFVLRDEPCRKCVHKEGENCAALVGDFLKDHDMEARYSYLDLFYGLQAWIAQDVKIEEMRKLAAMICFDWDRFLIEIGGNSREEIKAVRPESPEHVIASARVIVDGIMRGQTDAVQATGKTEATEEGMAAQGETVPSDSDG